MRKILFFLLISIIAYAKPLIVGMELAYPPFETVDEKGNPSGISVDISHELGSYLNREVKIENISYVGLIPALKSGKIDLIISSLSRTSEREKSIAFSDPYIRNGLCLLLPIDAKLSSASEIKKEKIVVKQGTTSERHALTHFPNATIISLDKDTSCVMELIQKKADVFIYDQLSIFKFWQQYPDKTKALINPIAYEEWTVGLRKEDKTLRAQVNDFIHMSLEKGTLDRLKKKYLKQVYNTCAEKGIDYCFE